MNETLVDVIATALGDARPDGPITTRHMANELSCKGMHLLLAEDNPVNVKLMEILLRNLGCTFDTVPDGQAACAALKKNDYDVVLMDVFMPVMNGIDATKTIREEINRKVPIIALTAAALQEEQKKCHESGMDDILLKPINVNELKEKLTFITLILYEDRFGEQPSHQCFVAGNAPHKAVNAHFRFWPVAPGRKLDCTSPGYMIGH